MRQFEHERRNRNRIYKFSSLATLSRADRQRIPFHQASRRGVRVPQRSHGTTQRVTTVEPSQPEPPRGKRAITSAPSGIKFMCLCAVLRNRRERRHVIRRKHKCQSRSRFFFFLQYRHEERHLDNKSLGGHNSTPPSVLERREFIGHGNSVASRRVRKATFHFNHSSKTLPRVLSRTNYLTCTKSIISSRSRTSRRA